ncbi:MAG: bifunctional phosphoribosyl-AMP cyclohydrolase/phosphoribosyl-ATP diphosphatase HisIE, partial [Solirubrobacteraceae bacterium]|nr:bifunctional phosphoribosyl-AMP cyclohydrolase/phosphoribosyl-ATP diphosphatase HisIE [Solirubrobacteraceae bacterium]
MSEIAYDDRGLVPVVVQDEASGEVLMLAYANAEAVALTLSSGELHL